MFFFRWLLLLFWWPIVWRIFLQSRITVWKYTTCSQFLLLSTCFSNWFYFPMIVWFSFTRWIQRLRFISSELSNTKLWLTLDTSRRLREFCMWNCVPLFGFGCWNDSRLSYSEFFQRMISSVYKWYYSKAGTSTAEMCIWLEKYCLETKEFKFWLHCIKIAN